MKSKTFSLKYMLMTYRLDMLWLPAAFWALFLIISWMVRDSDTGFPVCVAYLGAALPLIGGILAAYAILDDPALELQFATPRPAWLMLLERLGMILVLSAICAFAYQGVLPLLSIDLAPLGSFAGRQLAWLAPTLAMIALGSAVAFANRSSTAGAAVVGLVWIFEIILRDWLLSGRVGTLLLLILGSNYPDNPALRANQATLVGIAIVLLALAWALLRRQERYI
ncbi:MAG: hypothetical protein EHM21_12150 [Chloroflexi bacterium]|nr:MAG: hypothetical protein EHM21_12150 [Chloroflexota bacterium]